MSIRWALMSRRPSSNTAKRPQGPAPMMTTSVLIVSLMPCPAVGRLLVGDCRGLSRRPARDAIIGNRDRAPQVRAGLVRRLAGGRNRDVGLGVERLSAVEEREQGGHGARRAGHGPHVALAHDALH